MPTPENPSIRRERITVELLIPNDGQCPSFDDSDLDSVFRAVRSGTIATSHEVMESHLIRGEVAFEACERLGVDPAFFGLDVPRNTNLDKPHNNYRRVGRHALVLSLADGFAIFQLTAHEVIPHRHLGRRD